MYAWATSVGVSIPYVCVVLRILCLTADMMMSRFLRVYGAHHTNAASFDIHPAREYSVRSTECDSFKSFRGIHDSLPFFHLTKSFQPSVVFLSLLVLRGQAIYLSSFDIAVVSSL